MATFDEVLAVLEKNRNGEASPSDTEVMLELSAEADRAATEIFLPYGEKYIIGMITLIQSCALTHLITNGELDMMKAVFVGQDDEMQSFITLVIKLAIGFAAMEELR